MARHRVSASCTQRSSSPPSSISLPPQSHLGELPVSSYVLRPELSRSSATGGSRDDTEIGVFDAKRYFSEGHDNERCDLYRRDSSSSSVDGYMRHGLSFSFNSTPTASSETSWHSQSGLLANPSGSVAVSASSIPPSKDPPRLPSSACRRWLFSGSCSCYGKKSPDVQEKCWEPMRPICSGLDRSTFGGGELGLGRFPKRTTPEETPKYELDVDKMITAKMSSRNGNFFSSSNRFSPEVGRRTVNSGSPFCDSGGFSFPILNPSTFNFAQKPARKSLEVFRPTDGTAAFLSTQPELQRRAAVFCYSGEADRQSFSFPIFSKPPPVDDDAASDTSSDLFEIETFSTQTTHLSHNSLEKIPRDLNAEVPSRASNSPSDCYAPSELSIQWSVTTAEGFDRASQGNFSSSASDFGELRFVRAEPERERSPPAAGDGRRRRSGLLSCRSQKAVSVGPNPVRLRSGMNRELTAP